MRPMAVLLLFALLSAAEPSRRWHRKEGMRSGAAASRMLDVERLERRAVAAEVLWNVGSHHRGSPRALHGGRAIAIDGICHNGALAMRGGLTNQLFKLANFLSECCEAVLNECNVGVVLLPVLSHNVGVPVARARATGVPVASVVDLAALSQAVWQVQPGCIVTDNATLHSVVATSSQQTSTLSLPAAVRIVHQPNGRHMRDFSDMVSALYGKIKPAAVLKPALARCIQQVRERVGSDAIVVHMRCETDWYPKYCSQREKYTRPPAKVCFTPKEIAMKVMHTPHLVQKASGVVLLYSAENLAPAFSGSRTRPTSVWPAQVRRVSAASLACFDGVKTYTERSVLSFFIAIAAPGFVGLLTSTLSNAIVLHRQLHGKLTEHTG